MDYRHRQQQPVVAALLSRKCCGMLQTMFLRERVQHYTYD